MSDRTHAIEDIIDRLGPAGEVPQGVDSELMEDIEFDLLLQKKIDASLSRVFASEPTANAVHRSKMEAMIRHAENASANSASADNASVDTKPEPASLARSQSVPLKTLVGLAAAVLMLVGATFFWQPAGTDLMPVGPQRSLVQIYNQTVDSGFNPYYDCKDPVHFAREFRKRQGVPLELLPMPEGLAMAGLARPGGISRESTAMLGSSDGEPIMVFVDRLDRDSSYVTDQVGTEGCNIFRVEKFGLVFYEVSRLDEPRLIDYFGKSDLTDESLELSPLDLKQ